MLLVSCTHAMVHTLECSIGSVEQVVSKEFRLTKEQSGQLGMMFRLPYGLGALLAGMLADRLGARRVLTMYLAGSAAVCASFLFTPAVSLMYGQLFVLGVFASMYHPAGLALLANSLPPSDRVRALGMHGVFGSTGISVAPLLAGITLSIREDDWRGYFLVLCGMCGALAILAATRLKSVAEVRLMHSENPVASGASTVTVSLPRSVVRLQRLPFAALVISSGLSGVVYGGFLHFLKRYLSEAGTGESAAPFLASNQDTVASFYTAVVLSFGAAGQWLTGRYALRGRLPEQLALVYFGNAPLLWWMSVAQGNARLVAACLLAFVHFMNQPLYNSLLPEFMPANRRSTWFGFSNMIGFGVGAVGPWLVGRVGSDRDAYLSLAMIAMLAGLFPLLLKTRWMTGSESATDWTQGTDDHDSVSSR